MVAEKIDGLSFTLKEFQDFSWLSQYGKVFFVLDVTSSGCICFGIEKDDKKYFFKIAGANTIEARLTPEEAVKLLMSAVDKYKRIKDFNLIKYIDSFFKDNLFVVIFEYAEGECLLDYWNYDKYVAINTLESPAKKFKKLSIEKKLNVIEKLFVFFENVIDSNYVAAGFYFTNIIYNFNNDDVKFCDIDLFKDLPATNNLGRTYYGTMLQKSPEENMLGAVIDEKTNVFTLGALIFDILSYEINYNERYEKEMFVPVVFEKFLLSRKTYEILIHATDYDRNNRYETIKSFHKEFNESLI